MEKSINILTNLDTLGVSLVHRGANKKKFAIAKSEDVMDEKIVEMLSAVLKEAGYDGEDKIIEQLKKAALDDKAMNAVNGAIRILSAFSDNPEIKKLLDGLKAAVGGEKYPAPKAKAKDDEKKYPMPMAKALEGLPEEQRAMFEPIAKAMFEAAERASIERVQKAEERATATEAILKAERDERLTKEFVSIAKGFDKIPGQKPEELGLVLKSLHDASPDLCKKVEAVLKSAQAALAESAIFVEKGKGGEGSGDNDAWTNIEKAASAAAQ